MEGKEPFDGERIKVSFKQRRAREMGHCRVNNVSINV